MISVRLPPDLKKEVLHISIGVLIGLTITVGVFALLGRFEWRVLFGALLGGACAIGNFYYLARSVQRSLDNADRARHIMQSSYSLRLLIDVAALVVAFVFDEIFHWLPVVIGLLLPRLTIFVMQLLGIYNPDELSGDHSDTPKGSDDTL